MATAIVTADVQVQASQRVLEEIFTGAGPRNFQVRFWDGSLWEAEPGQPTTFTLVLNHPGAVRQMFWPPHGMVMGRAFVYDDFNIEGDMVSFVRLLSTLAARERPLFERLKLAWQLWSLPKFARPPAGRRSAELQGKVHSPERDRQAISYHYDMSNAFFAKVLDKHMQYTCGVYDHPGEDQDTAQTRKLELHCKKLRLQPGEKLIDIGCGWGGMIAYAAEQHGVLTTGVTLSEKQAEWARETIRARGLTGRAQVVHDDYRNLDENQVFDKAVTVCVLEHFGRAQYPTYFQKVWRLLKPGGLLLIQQITLSGREGMRLGRQFSQGYVFPDGELAPVSTTLREAEAAGFEVRDVESLREHYPLTLKAWLDNVEQRHEELVAIMDEAACRVFRFYFAGALHGFQSNVYNLHHILLVKPDRGQSGLPMSRKDWYA